MTTKTKIPETPCIFVFLVLWRIIVGVACTKRNLGHKLWEFQIAGSLCLSTSSTQRIQSFAFTELACLTSDDSILLTARLPSSSRKPESNLRAPSLRPTRCRNIDVCTADPRLGKTPAWRRARNHTLPVNITEDRSIAFSSDSFIRPKTKQTKTRVRLS